MRREELYLSDIVEAADAIREFLAGIDRAAFFGSNLIQSAVLQKLIVIGEAAAKLPKEFRERHMEVEWSDIVAFRNIAVHSYFSVDWSIVFFTAMKDVPELRRLIANLLAREYPDSP
ncbi:MAG: DUF86 domain-containing protein [Geobacteraceae bacterium]|nr:DUF86 domain-containing protein [Geobacteraceae bacterium]